jgi:hypothetical protein
MATVTVCKACGNDMGQLVDGSGKPDCGNIFGPDSPDHNVSIEITVPDIAHCSDCKQVATYQDGRWLIGDDQPSEGSAFRNAQMEKLPFYDASNYKYYCGCRGWE